MLGRRYIYIKNFGSLKKGVVEVKEKVESFF